MAEMKEIVCKVCGRIIERDEMKTLIQERVIADDDQDGTVKERFFTCPACEQHYTITCFNRRMQLKIQKRQQLLYKVRQLYKRRGDVHEVRKLQEQDEKLKNELLDEAHYLRRKYLKED